MSAVIPIHGGRRPGEPDPDLVADLEKLLARARAGDLLALGFATVDEHGKLGTGWVGAGGTRWPLGCAIAMLGHRYPAELMGEASP